MFRDAFWEYFESDTSRLQGLANAIESAYISYHELVTVALLIYVKPSVSLGNIMSFFHKP